MFGRGGGRRLFFSFLRLVLFQKPNAPLHIPDSFFKVFDFIMFASGAGDILQRTGQMMVEIPVFNNTNGLNPAPRPIMRRIVDYFISRCFLVPDNPQGQYLFSFIPVNRGGRFYERQLTKRHRLFPFHKDS